MPEAGARLYTIPQSHYAEKARWALDRSGIGYVEHPHAPLFHMLHTVPRGGRTVPQLAIDGRILVDSTDILPPGYRSALCSLDEAPAAMREEVLRLRATPAGGYALRLFAENRGQARV